MSKKIKKQKNILERTSIESFFKKKQPFEEKTKSLLLEQEKTKSLLLDQSLLIEENSSQLLPQIGKNQEIRSKSLNPIPFINLPKHAGGRLSRTDEEKWKDLCLQVETKYIGQFEFLEGRKMKCTKCQTILEPKKLRGISKHVSSNTCKEFKNKEEKEKIFEEIEKQNANKIPAEVLCGFQNAMIFYEKEKKTDGNLDAIKNKIRNFYCSTDDPSCQTLASSYIDVLTSLEKMALVSIHHPQLLEKPTTLNFEMAHFTMPLSQHNFTDNPFLLRAYLKFHERKSESLKTVESVKIQTKVVEDYLSYIYDQKKEVNRGTILSYLNLKEYKNNHYEKSTKLSYLSILNGLLLSTQPKATLKRESTFKERMKKTAKLIPNRFQTIIFETLKEKSMDLYYSAHLLKFAGVRATEIIYLRRNNLTKIKLEGEETSYWLVYRQSKTDFQKAVRLPEHVFGFYEALTYDSYLVQNYRTARGYRRAYRTALKTLTIPFYTPHCWRHTGATEFLLKSKHSGLDEKEGLLLAMVPWSCQYWLEKGNR